MVWGIDIYNVGGLVGVWLVDILFFVFGFLVYLLFFIIVFVVWVLLCKCDEGDEIDFIFWGI